MNPPTLPEMRHGLPDADSARARAAHHVRSLGAADSAQAQAAVLREWDREDALLATQRALVQIRYQADTTSPSARADRERLDDMSPELTEARLAFLRELVGSRFRPGLEALFGAHCFNVWSRELLTYDPLIAGDKREEARLCREYTELFASIRLRIGDREMTISQSGALVGDADRDVRRSVQQARLSAIGAHAERLDAIYGQLVSLRDGMGRKLGHASYLPLAYDLRHRDYTPGHVARFRRQVREILVPLSSRIRARRAAALGVSDYGYHDLPVRDRRGVPKPMGSGSWMLDRAETMFAGLGDDFSALWRILRDRQLLDLESRPGKAVGGFCSKLPAHGVPFVFANFNGTAADVDVFTHECGHAFQAWRSMAVQPLSLYASPTADAAEIHSMSLEMLCHPFMELFFGDDAGRYRAGHLESAILFIPYGAAIDEFQHVVHEQPSLTPEQRAEAWRDIERAYLPEWRYQGIPFAESGRVWQVQRHVYTYPFYYIDYCLAQSCALQFHRLAAEDRDAAMAAYRGLCERGGSMPFSQLVASAGLESPFTDGAMAAWAEGLERAVPG